MKSLTTLVALVFCLSLAGCAATQCKTDACSKSKMEQCCKDSKKENCCVSHK